MDESGQTFVLARDDAQELGALVDSELGVVVQDLGEGADRGERRAQLVRHGRQELVLAPIEFLEAVVDVAQLLRRDLELVGLLLELAARGEHPRGLVQEIDDLADFEGVLVRHRGERDVRRCGAGGAGEQALGERQEFRLGVTVSLVRSTPRSSAQMASARSARSSPTNRPSSPRTAATGVSVRHAGTSAGRSRRKAPTKRRAWRSSADDWVPNDETPTYNSRLTSRLQTSECERGSSPLSPKSA